MNVELSGWGRYPVAATDLVQPGSPDAVPAMVAGRTGAIARGNGRAYGDAAIGEETTVSLRGLDRMRAFDPATGWLTVEAGVTLAEIVEAFLPRGFFPAVVPGTQFVTVGGMIAADVHGKNHHRDGGFGDHVAALELLLPDGSRLTCSRAENAELFHATIGGMGLTGYILAATIRLIPVETGWMRQRTLVAETVADTVRLLDAAQDATYSVAWIDGLARGAALGRSLVYLGEHATRAELGAAQVPTRFGPAAKAGPGVPFDLPALTLNRFSVAAFNEAYFRLGAAKAGSERLVGWRPYFFPLDGVADWNRIYGRNGFVQYQFVLPAARSADLLPDLLDRIARRGSASFLAVLKRLGRGGGLLSFPFEGHTLALDMKMEPGLLAFLADCDRLVAAAGGRLYLAKDARQTRATFEAGYPGLDRFRDIRRRYGLEGRLASRLSRRIGL